MACGKMRGSGRPRLTLLGLSGWKQLPRLLHSGSVEQGLGWSNFGRSLAPRSPCSMAGSHGATGTSPRTQGGFGAHMHAAQAARKQWNRLKHASYDGELDSVTVRADAYAVRTSISWNARATARAGGVRRDRGQGAAQERQERVE